MSLLPYILANGVGNWPDANKILGNDFWLFAMMKGTQISNGGLENWTAATSFTNPANAASLADSWTWEKGGTSSATANVSRDAAVFDSGVYGLKKDITIAGSSDSYLRLVQTLSDYTRLAGLTLTFGAKIKVSTADKVRVSIYDGVTQVYSAYHTGSGSWEKLTATLTLSGSPTQLTVKIETISDFVAAVYVDSCFLYITDASMDLSSRAALLYFIPDERQGLLTTYLDLTPTATAPALRAGRLYLNSVDGQLYICKDGTTWSVCG